MSERIIKIKYIGGKGIELSTPLSDGRSVFYKDEVYEVKESDYARLISGSKVVFEEVKEKKEKTSENSPKAKEEKTSENSPKVREELDNKTETTVVLSDKNA